MSPCVTDRLVGAPSTTCEGKLLIDPQNPADSFILDKLNHTIPACGARMPLGGKLPDPKLGCVDAWVHSVAQAAR
jgi:hypothetical protein